MECRKEGDAETRRGGRSSWDSPKLLDTSTGSSLPQVLRSLRTHTSTVSCCCHCPRIKDKEIVQKRSIIWTSYMPREEAGLGFKGDLGSRDGAGNGDPQASAQTELCRARQLPLLPQVIAFLEGSYSPCPVLTLGIDPCGRRRDCVLAHCYNSETLTCPAAWQSSHSNSGLICRG